MTYYKSFNEYLKDRFGCKVHKVTINAGFTCPNRDGSLSYDGCIFCDEKGSAAEPSKPEIPMKEEIAHGKMVMSEKYRAKKFLAYFQAYTNTYADVALLEELYRDAIDDDDIVGLIIGTRPDCVNREILTMLADIAKEKYVQIEYGLQTTHDDSLKYLNRHHTYADFLHAFNMTREFEEIKIGVHIILGITRETETEMIKTAETISDLGVDVVKMHHMHVIKGTYLEELYLRGDYKPMEAQEYISLLVTFIEHLSSDIAIDRLIGNKSQDVLVAPRWSIKKRVILSMVEEEFKKRNTFQGAKYEGK